MNGRIRGSDVYVVQDIERILAALAGAAMRYPGDYGAGYQDALQAVAVAVGGAVDTPQIERIHEVTEYRHERTVERYQAPAERQFKIVGQREEPAQVARQAPRDMTGDNVNVSLFNPKYGRLSRRKEGYIWVGDDGSTAFWDAADWQRISIDEATSWGELIPDGWAVLVRHAFADRMRRQIGQRVQVVDNRRLLR